MPGPEAPLGWYISMTSIDVADDALIEAIVCVIMPALDTKRAVLVAHEQEGVVRKAPMVGILPTAASDACQSVATRAMPLEPLNAPLYESRWQYRKHRASSFKRHSNGVACDPTSNWTPVILKVAAFVPTTDTAPVAE